MNRETSTRATSTRVVCEGCLHNEPSQKYHMGPTGCLIGDDVRPLKAAKPNNISTSEPSNMSSQRFFVMAKPDAVRRGLTGEIISRFERKGFQLERMRLLSPDLMLVEEHYREHRGKSFYDELVSFTLSGPVCAMIWSGNIKVARSLIGATLPWEAAPGTIRGDFASSLPENLVHCSDTPENANREVELWTERF